MQHKFIRNFTKLHSGQWEVIYVLYEEEKRWNTLRELELYRSSLQLEKTGLEDIRFSFYEKCKSCKIEVEDYQGLRKDVKNEKEKNIMEKKEKKFIRKEITRRAINWKKKMMIDEEGH